MSYVIASLKNSYISDIKPNGEYKYSRNINRAIKFDSKEEADEIIEKYKLSFKYNRYWVAMMIV